MKKSKYNGSGTHRRAILHMIGQSEHIFNELPRIADIAAWMGVSKKTATKYINILCENRELYRWKIPYKNTFKWVFSLQGDLYSEYLNGDYKHDYNMYAQCVMKVILQ